MNGQSVFAGHFSAVIVQGDLGDIAELFELVIAVDHVLGGDGIALAVNDVVIDLNIIGSIVDLGYGFGCVHLQFSGLKHGAGERTVAQVSPDGVLGPVTDGGVIAPGTDGKGIIIYRDDYFVSCLNAHTQACRSCQ